MAKKGRGNREGSILHRADGRWEARAIIGYSPETGRPQRRVATETVGRVLEACTTE